MYAIGYPLLAAVNIVQFLLTIYAFVVIAAVILSWVNPDPLNPLVRVLRNMTEPVMDKIRPYIPLVGGLDLTPIVLVAAIVFINQGVMTVLARLARDMI
jgi:YggT family protein